MSQAGLDVAAVRAAIGVAVDGQWLGAPWPASVRWRSAGWSSALLSPPSVVVGLPTITYDSVGCGEHQIEVEVHAVLPGDPTSRETSDLWDRAASRGLTGSVVDLLEADPTLGGVVDTLSVLSVEPTNALSAQGSTLSVVTINLDIRAS